MKKLIKYIFVTLSALFATALITLTIAAFIPNQTYQNWLVSFANKNNIVVDFQSPLVIERSLSPTIKINNLRAHKMMDATANNAAQSSEKAFDLVIDSATVGVNLLPLLKGQLSISEAQSKDIAFSMVLNNAPQTETKETPKEKQSIEQTLAETIDALSQKIDINNINLINTHVQLSQYVTTEISDENAKQTDNDNNNNIQATEPELNDTETSPLTKPLLTLQLKEVSCSDALCGETITMNGAANNIDFTLDLSKKTHSSDADDLNYLLDAKLGQSTVSVETSVNTNDNNTPIQSSIQANIPLINEWLRTVNINAPDIGPLNFSGSLNGNLTGASPFLGLNNLDLVLDDDQIKADIKGNIEGLGDTSNTNLTLIADIANITPLSSLFKPLEGVSGNVTANMNINGIGNVINVDINHLDATVDDTSIKASGKIEDIIHSFIPAKEGATSHNAEPIPAPNNELALTINGNSLNIVNYFLPKNIRMPQWGPIDGNLIIKQSDNRIVLNDIDINMRGKSSAKISGSLNLNDLSASNIALEASLNSLEELSSFTSGKLPEFGPVSAKGNLVFTKGSALPSLTDISGGYLGEYGDVKISGTIGNLFLFKEVDLQWDGDVKSIQVAEVFAPVKLPDLGPVKTSGSFVSKPRPNNEKLLEFDLLNIKAAIIDDATNLSVSGNITNLISQRANLDINATIDAKKLTLIKAFIKEDVPIFGTINGNAYLKGNVTDGFHIGLDNVALDSEHFQVSANGDFIPGKNIQSEEGIDLKASAASLKAVLNQFNINADINGKTEATLTVKPIKNGIAISDINLSLDENNIAADINVINEEGKLPFVGGDVKINNVNLIELLKLDEKRAPKEPRAKTPFFTETPLFTTYFKQFNTNINFDIVRLTTQFLDLANTQMSLVSNNGILNIGPLDSNVAGGRVKIDIQSNLNTKPELTSIYFNVDGIDAKQLDLARDADQVGEESKLTALFDLKGEGGTVKAFMGSLEGKALIDLRHLNVQSGALKLIGTDFLFNLLQTINPFSENTSRIPFKCAVVNLDIKHGIASSKTGIAAESDSFVVLGDANINLNTEKLDAHIETKTTKGIGISISQFANIVKVGGHIYDPKIAISGEGLLKTGASIGAAVFTGGATLLAQGLWDRISASGDICGAALNAEKVDIAKPKPSSPETNPLSSDNVNTQSDR